MEQINLDQTQAICTPTRRDEVHVPFKKFVLASDFSIPSRNPTTGDAGGAQLYWVEKYNGDPNEYITLGPGYITLNYSGMYLVACRVTMRPDTIGNTQRVVYMELNLDSGDFGGYGAYADGDVHRLTVNGIPATSSLYYSETSPGAGDSGGSSLLTQCVLPVIPFTPVEPPRTVSVFFFQQSDALQPQNLTPRDQDIWLQVAYIGLVDQQLEHQGLHYLEPPAADT